METKLGNCVFCYDGSHRDYFQEIIAKVNERFSGTRAEIRSTDSKENPLKGEVECMNILHRMAIVSTISGNSSLRNENIYPITPEESEQFFKKDQLRNSDNNYEDLALVIYDTNPEGRNIKEAQELKKELIKYKKHLGLDDEDLEKKLVVVNPGLMVDSSFFHNLKPLIIPGVTVVYPHDILSKVGRNLKFEYGHEKGLPLPSQTGFGKRILCMPEQEKAGLRVLSRNGIDYLHLGYEFLDSRNRSGKITFSY